MNYIGLILLTYIIDEEDAFWCLVFVMFEKGWRSIYIRNKTCKLKLVLRDLEVHIKQTFPLLHRRFEESQYLSMESTFTTQLITLYTYDAPIEISTRIFELFLIEGC
jgi:hypothetical protein